MSGIRLPLLCAFAGGCLSNAVLFGLWRPWEGAAASAAKQQRADNRIELVAAASAAPSVPQATDVVADNAANAQPALAQPAPALDSTVATPPAGSAVADVLTRLEAAYRERAVPVAAPAPPSAAQEPALAAAPADNTVAVAAPPPSVPAQPVAAVSPVLPPPTVTASLTTEAPAVAPAAVAPQVAAAPAFAPQEDARPTEIHYGDVNQNTYITNVRQGDVYLFQMQQLAMLQYMQLLGASPGVAAPARRAGGAGTRRAAFPSGITNPDNPWGFRFSPPNLVR